MNDALFIVSDSAAMAVTSLHTLAIPPAHVVTYATHPNLIELARTVALILQDKAQGL